MLLAGDFHRHLIEVPLILGAGQPPSDPIGERLAELEGPSLHSRMDDNDAASSQHLLGHAQAEWEAEIQPNCIADDLGWKAAASMVGANGRGHPVRLRDPAYHGKPPT